MKQVLIIIINGYQAIISPVLAQVFGMTCRYSPTCSEYAKAQIAKEGIITGSVKSLKRITSCQPFGTSKYEYR